MKRITGIAVTLAAVIGCSYVGNVGATTCKTIAGTLTISATAIAAENNHNVSVDRLFVPVEQACKLGVQLREEGVKRQAVIELASKVSDDAMVGDTLVNSAVIFGYNHGTTK